MEFSDTNSIVIIGAGPVGLCASLLLSQYGIQHTLVERQVDPHQHPQAHFVQCRSMEILRSIHGLDKTLLNLSTPIYDWGRFVYCTALFETTQHLKHRHSVFFATDDHVKQLEAFKTRDLSPTSMVHFPQNRLNQVLREHLDIGQTCRFFQGYDASIHELPDCVELELKQAQTGEIIVGKASFVVVAEGAHSVNRAALGIGLNDLTDKSHHLINVYFSAPELGRHLRERAPGMLYFVYSQFSIAVIVAHDLKQGEFVAQIPYFPPHQTAESFTQAYCIHLLRQFTQHQVELTIHSIKPWMMKSAVADRLLSPHGRCALVGDAAHQVMPAGGFGMNLGIQDVHNLMWKLASIYYMNGQCQVDHGSSLADHALLKSYQTERLLAAHSTAKLSEWNFTKSLAISNTLGLNYNLASVLSDTLSSAGSSARNKVRNHHDANRQIVEKNGKKTVFDSLGHAVFQKAMVVGLKSLQMLEKDNVFSRHQRQMVKNKIAKKDITLKLMFLNHELGFNYFIPNAKQDDLDIEPFDFSPKLAAGVRLPHFWMRDVKGHLLSSLDVINQVSFNNNQLYYVCVHVNQSKRSMDADDQISEYGLPVLEVWVDSECAIEGQYQYQLEEPLPDGLPQSFSIISRPDGIVHQVLKEPLVLDSESVI